MLRILKVWYHKYFSDPQAIMLAFLLIVGTIVILTMGGMLAPVLASIVLAYLLEAGVVRIVRMGAPRIVAVSLIFVVFLAVLFFVAIGMMPLLSNQLTQLLGELPSMIAQSQQYLMRLPEKYPDFISDIQISEFLSAIRNEIAELGRGALSFSVASVLGLITVLVYLILVPILVFFFMKDKDQITQWGTRWLPRDSELAVHVWREMDLQIGNYVRGKVLEIIIIFAVCFLTFTFLGLNFSLLLAVLVGLSVIVPYIGATVVTIPVAVIGFFQWGISGDFGWLMLAYFVIQILDGNVLVPLLFSEVVNLHPIAIIVAILVFGGLWGFWGVFFAIPLATLVQAVIKAWPLNEMSTEASGEAGER